MVDHSLHLSGDEAVCGGVKTDTAFIRTLIPLLIL